MVLKRKRSSSELCSSPSSSSGSSTSSSPPQNNALPLLRFGMAGPAHLDSRTLKRFRNNRPSEREVHQRTLGLLYSAQQRPSELQEILDNDTSPSVDQPIAPTTPQQSLHRFWTINSAPSSKPTATHNQPMISTSASGCEDCGGNIGGNDDPEMDLDGADGAACSACGKNVCFSCSVSNLGEQKRCLQCAGRINQASSAGWPSVDFVMKM